MKALSKYMIFAGVIAVFIVSVIAGIYNNPLLLIRTIIPAVIWVVIWILVDIERRG